MRQPIKRRFAHILGMATATIMLGPATMSAGRALVTNYHDYNPWANAGAGVSPWEG